MTRSMLSTLALAVVLGACVSKPKPESTAPQPSATVASADGNGRRGPGMREEMLMRGITLSADQQQRVDSIRASYRTQMEQLRQQSGGDRRAMRGQMRPLMERQQADLRAVLTADQQAQFDRNVAEMRERMRQGGRGQPPR